MAKGEVLESVVCGGGKFGGREHSRCHKILEPWWRGDSRKGFDTQEKGKEVGKKKKIGWEP